MSDVNMDRLKDSPTDQDVAALSKIGQKTCDVCGGPNGHIWMHCDSWTKWMRYGCGCNVMHCDTPECNAGAEELAKKLRAENRDKAEKAETEMLKTISLGQLASLRSRYFNTFNCAVEFRNWVSDTVGEARMKEMLDVPCACCGNIIGMPKYTFEDKDGNRSLKTIEDIEAYCYQVMGRDPKTDPFKTQLDSIKDDMRSGGMDKAEIGFQTPIWHYYEQRGWEHDSDFADPRWDEALKNTRGPDCGGTYEWSYGHFIYHLPTKTYLGAMAKRGGDWPQIVQINRKQLEKEQEALRERFGENYHKHPDFWEAYRAIEVKQEWVYYCGHDCCAKSTDEHGTLFI